MSTDVGDSVLDFPFRAPNALDPPKEWAELRDRCPVAHVRLPSGDKAVLLTRYEDVRQVLSDPRFTRNLTAEDAARTTANEAGGVFESEAATEISEGEQHQKWRRLIMKWFTVKRISMMQERIEQMANHLIDEMVKKGPPQDLITSLAFPLPVWVICELLGVPGVDRDKLGYWSNTMLNLTQYSQEEIDKAQAEFAHYLMGHIAEKRKAPGDDLLSELATTTDEGQKLSEKVLLMTGQGLLVAGHETTSNTIAKMMAMLLSDRSRWERLLADPSLVRTAVEEALRFDANAGFGLPRYLTHELEVGGATLPRGTTVVCAMAAANRDERAFERAGEMDISRSPNTHISFGAGPHSCVGQALARTELQTTLNVLLKRLPGLKLAVPPEELSRREGLLIGGLERVPVIW